MKNKVISIIGGSGFVGTYLCRLLAENGVKFEIIDIKKSNQFGQYWKYGDIRDPNSIRSALSGDVVVHLAAVHRDDVKDKNEYHNTNVHGTKNVIDVCSELGVSKIIFTSSVAVYGFAEPDTDENGPIRPFNEYGKTKFLAEELLRKWNENSENSLTIVRPTVIFGIGNRGNVYNLFKQISDKKFLMIGGGNNRKSVAYVKNIVAFLFECIGTEEKYGLYNYVDKPDMNMNELVSHVRKSLFDRDNVGLRLPYWLGLSLGYLADFVTLLTGKNLPLSSIRIRKFCATTAFDSTEATRNEFQAPFSVAEGIRETLNAEFIQKDPSIEPFYTE